MGNTVQRCVVPFLLKKQKAKVLKRRLFRCTTEFQPFYSNQELFCAVADELHLDFRKEERLFLIVLSINCAKERIK